MSFKTFLEFIRIQAKSASLLPFLFGLAFTIYYFGTVNWVNTVVYFVGQMSIAFFVTGFNNVQDYYLAKDLHYRDTYNIIGRKHLDPKKALRLMLMFLVIACAIGAWLVYRTNLLLLFIGGAAILVAIFYTYGPVPFSRIPVGEVLSGFTEGLGTIFIVIYVNTNVDLLAALHLSWSGRFIIDGNFWNLLTILLVGLPIVIFDGTVMFADNICDLAQDQKNDRYTLPFYLGKERALKIYHWIPVFPYLLVALGMALRVLPWTAVIVLLDIPLIRSGWKAFSQKQVKEETFIYSIRNLLSFGGLEIIGLLLGILIDAIW